MNWYLADANLETKILFNAYRLKLGYGNIV